MNHPLMIGLTYHEDYNKYDLGLDHPLIGDKSRNTLNFFKKKKIIDDIDVITADYASDDDLLRVHPKNYIDKVKDLSKSGGYLSYDTPAPPGIYDIARLAAGGTIIAGEQLFKKYNCTVNPLAGFHHASKEHSSGFCFFNDIAVVIEFLREKYDLSKFLIIDLDVHHANGTQDIYYEDPSVLLISFHQDGRTLYPGTGAIDKIGSGAGEGYNINLPLPPGAGSKSYLEAFDIFIPKISLQFKPELIIYQSGVDTHHEDPLADLKLIYQTYYYLASKVNNISKSTCNKLLVLFGGGYNSLSCVHSYYNIVCGLLNKKEIIKEEEIQDARYSEVLKIIDELKSKISPYWSL